MNLPTARDTKILSAGTVQLVKVINNPTEKDVNYLFLGTLAFLIAHGLFFGWLFFSKEAEGEMKPRLKQLLRGLVPWF